MDFKKEEIKEIPKTQSASLKKLQADLVEAVKKTDFKKAKRLRESIKNLQK